jgi:hypothetical protein
VLTRAVEAIDALALYGDRCELDGALIAARVKARDYREGYEGQARQYDPVPGMKKWKDAEGCPDYCGQGGEGLKGQLHVRKSGSAPVDAGPPLS